MVYTVHEWSFYDLTVYCCYAKLIAAANVSKFITIQGNMKNTMNCKTIMHAPIPCSKFPQAMSTAAIVHEPTCGKICFKFTRRRLFKARSANPHPKRNPEQGTKYQQVYGNRDEENLFQKKLSSLLKNRPLIINWGP